MSDSNSSTITTVDRPALILDRDGVILVEKHYLSDPAGVELIPGSAAAIARAKAGGWKVVIATNQSGIARGYFTIGDYERVTARMLELLTASGAFIDACYFCPYHPDGTVPEYTREHPDRKPGPGMLLKAAAEHAIDLSISWMIGDKAADAEAAVEAGLAGAVMVGTGHGSSIEQRIALEKLKARFPDYHFLRAADISEAVGLIGL